MIPDVSQALGWLECNPQALEGIRRGIERETLRVTEEGQLVQSDHPAILGSALTNRWITTDFAEAMLEFVTPVDGSVEHLMAYLRDIHRYVALNLGSEQMWPMSMPCFIGDEEQIRLAQYGSSNLGRFKTLYREGLKNRYGALMQTISGVHYNFSLPLSFWQARDGVQDEVSGKETISDGYFRLIRNYYRFGWVIPYLFGASPALCPSFLKGREVKLPFEKLPSGACYLPYATSLRMSDLGYTNKSQDNLGITFNTLNNYVSGLKKAIHTHSEEYSGIGIKVDGVYRQLNSNVLQIENELYSPIRPKRVPLPEESPSDALQRGGIEYVEVRALDINPFSAVGVTELQARFLDLFLIWCALADAPEMSSSELICARKNWTRVILEGRKPGQQIQFGCEAVFEPLNEVGKALFADLLRVADVLDRNTSQKTYATVCSELLPAFDNPDLTLSAQTLEQIRRQGITGFAMSQAAVYREELLSEPLEVTTEEMFKAEALRSLQKQREIEESDSQSFDEYVTQHAAG